MARSKITNTTDDLINDSGAVLFSIVKGEQLEFPVTLNFIENATIGYVYEAVVVEGNNVAGQTEAPVTIRPAGVQTTLTVRIPIYEGTWSASTTYQAEDVVLYSGKYYRRLANQAAPSAVLPTADPLWQETVLNRVYIQFPSTLSATWAQAPTTVSSVYGFFELRVTEPSSVSFRRTWKPVRGMIEIQFSPTDIVPDV